MIGLAVFTGGAIISGFLFEHIKDRALAWWNPEFDASGKGFVAIHSLLALRTGGIFGVSLTQGAAASIPKVAKDLIIIPIIEELGFIGTASILIVFLLLAVNGIKIAIASDDDFSRFLAVGIVALITFQTLVVIGGAIGLIPLTGMVLSYVAYGGTATVVFYQMAALLLCVSSGQGKAKTQA